MGIRIGRFVHNRATLWGVVAEDTVHPLPGSHRTLRALLAQTDLAAQLEAATLATHGIPLASVRWLSPVTRDAQVVCQGVNYASHRLESGRAPEKPPFNTIFTKASSAICGPTDDIVRPPHVRLLDYEVELGIVVGTEIAGPLTITRENLHKYIAGLVIADDVSARDVQIPQGQWTKGKSYRTFCPVGPYLYLLNAAEIDAVDNLDLKLWVNGELRQAANTSQMLYKPHETLDELASVMDLFPGDLLMTGTPSGVGLKMPSSLVTEASSLFYSEQKRMEIFVQSQLEIPNYLKDGDIVRVAICSPDGQIDLGLQQNRVVPASGS
jgi:2-keto-4-pentenoate hydratase/2-oxohepta-3-ene-1,7-dioic acid hydratase in catechol pathway